MAAILGISESITTYDVEQVALVNVIGTIRILKAARKFSVPRVVLPISPDVSWLNPYTITKQTTEKFSKFFNKEYDIETVSLKFGKIYGPRERCLNFSMGSPFNYQFLIPTILIETLRGHTVQIYGDGNQKSEYIFIHDVIESFVRTLKIDKNLGGEVIPVGGNKNYSVNDIIETIEKCWDRKIEREYIKMRLGETPTEILLDNKKLKDVLDYELKWDLTKGLKETIPYYEQAFKDSS
jgi:UDP-glucose 4-epimerase